ncbi:glycosyltransferase [uncultured Flavobacterium sp.]|uniref:glycosyltransferase n=1 Tax=uncultured Flavobacterium sp. TaxID=165435 RepID=UPI0030C8841E
MRILLVGEFSRLHNSLKEGLIENGHDVVTINNGDGFKNYPSDYSNRATLSESKLGNIFRQIIYRITNFDISKIERGIRFYIHLNKLKKFDIVQLINEAPIQTTQHFEFYLLKKIFKHNNKVFLLCCGVDYMSMNHMVQKKERYSIMNPYFEEISEAKIQYSYMFNYLNKTHQKIHSFIYANIKGVIASDLDYVNPLQTNSKFLGLIPNPINCTKNEYSELKISNKINIFLGINSGNSYKKGVPFFEKALEIIAKKYSEKVNIKITKDIPYQQYIRLYNDSHILLDQVYGYDQGYNALEAMAKGKVVFTGADKEFLEYYNLKEDEVAINALPDVNYLVEKLSFLIENPFKIRDIGQNASNFIEKEHNHIKIAKAYLSKWK